MTLLAKLYLWATYRLYHELAWAYDLVSWLVSLGHWSMWREKALEYVVGNRVLEIGFGTGELLIEMAHLDLDVYGLDPSQEMQRVTARKMTRRNLAAPRVLGIAQKLPFPNETFDSIIATFPAGYILDPISLREVARLLRRQDPEKMSGGGRFIVVGLYASAKSPVVRRAVSLLFGPSTEHILSTYKRMAEMAGLNVTVDEGENGIVRIPVIYCSPKA